MKQRTSNIKKVRREETHIISDPPTIEAQAAGSQVPTIATQMAESQAPIIPAQAAESHASAVKKLRAWVYAARWPILLLLAMTILCEIGWLTYLDPADIARYQCYSLTFWLGSHATTLLPSAQCAFLHISTPQPALRMLPQEYPPLTLLAFSLPLVVPLPYYALAFALLMTLLIGGIYWLLVRSGARWAAPIFLFYIVVGAIAVVQERFDLLPAACTLICVLAAERGRWRMAYLALALGVLFKLYPIVMLPALFLMEQRAALAAQGGASDQGTWLARGWENVRRWHWYNSLLFAGLVVGVMGAFALLNVHEALMGSLNYFVQRPAQIESLAGSVIWAGSGFGVPYSIDFTFGSLNLTSNLMRLISPVDTLLSVVGILGVFWLQWRKKIDLTQTLVALLCVLITTGKVFSPQYLIWLFPLLAYMYARGNTNRLWLAGWAAISLLTTVIYIVYYSQLPNPAFTANLVMGTQIIARLPGFFPLVALRNLLLLLATLSFVCGWWGVRKKHV